MTTTDESNQFGLYVEPTDILHPDDWPHHFVPRRTGNPPGDHTQVGYTAYGWGVC